MISLKRDVGVEVGEGDEEGGEGGEEGGGGAGGGGRLVKFALVLLVHLYHLLQLHNHSLLLSSHFLPLSPPLFSPSLSFRRRRRKKKSASRAKLPNKPTDFQVGLP